MPYQYALDVEGLYPKNIGMDTRVVTWECRDELLRYCVNKAVELGIYTPPHGWEPFRISQKIQRILEKAKARSKPGTRKHTRRLQ